MLLCSIGTDLTHPPETFKWEATAKGSVTVRAFTAKGFDSLPRFRLHPALVRAFDAWARFLCEKIESWPPLLFP